ncbi:MAG TPA: HIT family protein [Ktedonobacteraceae bacterium]|nr:HIT family protein [Ktedonobacteraceae bacterium]
MQSGSGFSVDAQLFDPGCAFCNHNEITHILKETPHFLLAADHAPLVEGHILIIPKSHYTCYGDVPGTLDDELFALKSEVQRFFTRFYAPPVFWEHGIFRQTVFHAHLHCFPWGETGYDLNEGLHDEVITSQEDIRRWHRQHGQYFYMEDSTVALIFAPEMERYLSVMKNVFVRGITRRGGKAQWRPSQQRYEEGIPLLQATMEKWRQFQQEGANYAGESSTR